MPRVRAGFIAPMLLLKTDPLPGDGEQWAYQLKVDGYRAIAFKRDGLVHLRSRNDHDLGPLWEVIAGHGLAFRRLRRPRHRPTVWVNHFYVNVAPAATAAQGARRCKL
jgi:hypothetical protein